MDFSPPGLHQSMRFSREEYRSVLPFPSPGDPPNPGMEPASVIAYALAGGFLTAELPVKYLWGGEGSTILSFSSEFKVLVLI